MLILACNRTSRGVERLELAFNDHFIRTFWMSKMNSDLF